MNRKIFFNFWFNNESKYLSNKLKVLKIKFLVIDLSKLTNVNKFNFN